MKIKKGLGSELQSELARGLLQRRQNEQAEAHRADRSKDAPAGKVELSLARAIRSELNPEDIVTERRERVAALKAAIQNGDYNPSSQEIAEALTQEISFEILTGGSE